MGNWCQFSGMIWTQNSGNSKVNSYFCHTALLIEFIAMSRKNDSNSLCFHWFGKIFSWNLLSLMSYIFYFFWLNNNVNNIGLIETMSKLTDGKWKLVSDEYSFGSRLNYGFDTFVYQSVRNISFSGNFAYVLNDWS